MQLLKEKGVEFDAIDYFVDPVDEATLRELIEKLGLRPVELFRAKESLYNDLGIAEKQRTDDELIRVLVENPKLLQRPIVVRGDKAVIARPAEKVLELFG
jgi:arsenate reductase